MIQSHNRIVSLHRQKPLTALTKFYMQTKILKVVAQTEAVYVPSRKAGSGHVAKSVIRLKELGGEYEDEYACVAFGNLAECKFVEGDLVAAALRFQTREVNGQFYQDVVATEIQVI